MADDERLVEWSGGIGGSDHPTLLCSPDGPAAPLPKRTDVGRPHKAHRGTVMIRPVLTAALLGCLLASLPACAEEPKRIDADKAQEAAKALTDAVAKLELPVKTSLDGKAGTGLHAGKVAVFVTPDSKLTADALAKHEKGILPLGVLFSTDS